MLKECCVTRLKMAVFLPQGGYSGVSVTGRCEWGQTFVFLRLLTCTWQKLLCVKTLRRRHLLFGIPIIQSPLRKNKTPKKVQRPKIVTPKTPIFLRIKSRTVGYHFYQPPKKSLTKSLYQKKSTRKMKTPKKSQAANFKPKKSLRTSPSLIPLSTPPGELTQYLLSYLPLNKITDQTMFLLFKWECACVFATLFQCKACHFF